MKTSFDDLRFEVEVIGLEAKGAIPTHLVQGRRGIVGKTDTLEKAMGIAKQYYKHNLHPFKGYLRVCDGCEVVKIY